MTKISLNIVTKSFNNFEKSELDLVFEYSNFNNLYFNIIELIDASSTGLIGVEQFVPNRGKFLNADAISSEYIKALCGYMKNKDINSVIGLKITINAMFKPITYCIVPRCKFKGVLKVI